MVYVMEINLQKLGTIAILALSVWGLHNWWQGGGSTYNHGPGVIVPDDPIQRDLSSAASFRHKDAVVTPLADFELEARVLSAKWYSRDLGARWSPLDLAFGWGPMSDDSVLNQLKISQGGRFYRWRTKTNEYPIPRKDIIQHSANMHLIPADGTVEDAMEDVAEGDVVWLKGYLIKLKADDGAHWKSSLTRKDSGAGACEVIYVKDFEIVTDL